MAEIEIETYTNTRCGGGHEIEIVFRSDAFYHTGLTRTEIDKLLDVKTGNEAIKGLEKLVKILKKAEKQE